MKAILISLIAFTLIPKESKEFTLDYSSGDIISFYKENDFWVAKNKKDKELFKIIFDSRGLITVKQGNFTQKMKPGFPWKNILEKSKDGKPIKFRLTNSQILIIDGIDNKNNKISLRVLDKEETEKLTIKWK